MVSEIIGRTVIDCLRQLICLPMTLERRWFTTRMKQSYNAHVISYWAVRWYPMMSTSASHVIYYWHWDITQHGIEIRIFILFDNRLILFSKIYYIQSVVSFLCFLLFLKTGNMKRDYEPMPEMQDHYVSESYNSEAGLWPLNRTGRQASLELGGCHTCQGSDRLLVGKQAVNRPFVLILELSKSCLVFMTHSRARGTTLEMKFTWGTAGPRNREQPVTKLQPGSSDYDSKDSPVDWVGAVRSSSLRRDVVHVELSRKIEAAKVYDCDSQIAKQIVVVHGGWF